MAQDREQEGIGNDNAEDARGRLGRPLIIAATFAAGAAAALAAKAVLSRRKDSAGTSALGSEEGSSEDLATVLHRAALDVALAATSEAAERLSVDDQSEAQDREPALEHS